MEKIIKEGSILKSLPHIEKRQFLILGAVRFSGEIIDNSYQNLNSCLVEMSNKSIRRIPESFQFAWNIIDHSQRLIKFLHLLPSVSEHRKTKELLRIIKEFRNTFQHLDERLDRALMNNEHPVFGKLKWCMSYDGGKVNNYIAISGSLTFNASTNKYNVGKFNSALQPSEIILESVDNQKILEIDISSLYTELVGIIHKVEMSLLEQFRKHGIDLIDRSSTTDVLFKIVNGENNLIVSELSNKSIK